MEELKCPHCGKVFEVDEAGYAGLISQVRDKEFNKSVEEYKTHLAAEAEALRKAERTEIEKEVNELNGKLQNAENEKLLAVSKAEAIKDKAFSVEKEKYTEEITQLKGKLEQNKTEQNLAVMKAIADKEKEFSEVKTSYINTISELKIQIENQKTEAERQLIKQLDDRDKEWQEKTRLIEEERDRYKEFKTKSNNKITGESLEKHCEDTFNSMLRPLLPGVYFEKDNEVSKSGSKGDYIYREEMDGVPLLSIMFEMKNEMVNSENKHKNENFFKELDKDRNEKDCEYAVLVSMLESDSDYYNQGIVDISYKYPKMYVIRPQFLVPMITLLRNAALNAHSYRKELEEAKQAKIDVIHFETKLNTFKESFSKKCRLADQKFQIAISQIDDAIKDLENVKESLRITYDHLSKADNKLNEITVKKLVYGNPTMKELFKKASEIIDVNSNDFNDQSSLEDDVEDFNSEDET